MAEHRIAVINRPDIIVRPFRTLPINRHRERVVSITESTSGRAVRVDTYTTDGKKIAGSLCVQPRDLPAFLAVMAEAGAAIGVELPTLAGPTPTRARAP